MKTLLILMVYLPAILMAQEFEHFQHYNVQKNYLRGDIVQHYPHLWVARTKTKGLVPAKDSLAWAQVQLAGIYTWSAKKNYSLGRSVKFNGRTYFSKSLWPIPINKKYAKYKWIEFSHPAIGFDLPIIAPSPDAAAAVNTLLGIDENQNIIRDDYEILILMSDKPREIKKLALKAGEKYQGLMLIETNLDEITPKRATDIITGLTVAELCKRKINQDNGAIVAWSKSDYFNTFTRVQANYSLQNKLSELVDETQLINSIDDNPCQTLQR